MAAEAAAAEGHPRLGGRPRISFGSSVPPPSQNSPRASGEGEPNPRWREGLWQGYRAQIEVHFFSFSLTHVHPDGLRVVENLYRRRPWKCPSAKVVATATDQSGRMRYSALDSSASFAVPASARGASRLALGPTGRKKAGTPMRQGSKGEAPPLRLAPLALAPPTAVRWPPWHPGWGSPRQVPSALPPPGSGQGT